MHRPAAVVFVSLRLGLVGATCASVGSDIISPPTIDASCCDSITTVDCVDANTCTNDCCTTSTWALNSNRSLYESGQWTIYIDPSTNRWVTQSPGPCTTGNSTPYLEPATTSAMSALCPTNLSSTSWTWPSSWFGQPRCIDCPNGTYTFARPFQPGHTMSTTCSSPPVSPPQTPLPPPPPPPPPPPLPAPYQTSPPTCPPVLPPRLQPPLLVQAPATAPATPDVTPAAASPTGPIIGAVAGVAVLLFAVLAVGSKSMRSAKKDVPMSVI